ncbi:MAG: AsmA-like C-terminal region-containing protein [Planctomycetaceae bacterium]|nr:AsmA-like C-terminal region-containing protein [Planctomycetaceae bacterium]
MRRILYVSGWSLLAVLLGAVLLCALVLTQVNNQIKIFALAELEKRYPDFTFHIADAELVESKRIILKGVEIEAGSKRKIVSIGEIALDCPITLQTFSSRNLKIEHIAVRNPIISVTRSRSGHFTDWETLLAVKAGPGLTDSLKSVEVENAVILYSDETVAAEPVKLKLESARCSVSERTHWSVKSVFQGDQLRRLTVNAVFDSETKNWRAEADCKQFDWDTSLTPYLPFAAVSRPVNGRIDFTLQANSDVQAELGFRFQVKGIVSQGFLDVPELNRTVTGLNAKFYADNDGLRIDNLTAIGEASRIALSYTQQGLMKRRSAELTANVRGLTLDDKVAEVLSPFLNEKTQQILEKFDFNALADVHAELCYSDNRWKPKTVSLHVADLTFAYKAFAYKAERLSGTMYIDSKSDKNDVLNFRFVSRPDDILKVTVEGHYNNLAAAPDGVTDIVAENVPIDNKLITALPEAAQQLAEDLHPSGKLNAHLIFRLQADKELGREFDILLQETSAKYVRFPYPVNNITGMLQFRSGVWSFADVTGSNGNAVFQCSGTLHPDVFRLNVYAGNLPADEQLSGAVTETAKQQLLKSLHVQGSADINAQIVYQIASKQLDLRFQAVPRAGLSLCPDRFPYKFQNVAGSFLYDNGVVRSSLIKAVNGGVQMQTALDFRPAADGQSVLTLSDLHVTQLPPSGELLAALPANLRSIIVTTELRQPLDITGGIRFISGNTTVSQFDLTLTLRNNSVNLGFPAENVCGRVRLSGGSADDKLQINGGMILDSLTVQKLPVTEIQGQFQYSNNRLQFGTAANRLQPNVQPHPLTASFCGGKLYAEGLVMFADKISYSVNASLHGSDLALLARQLSPAATRTAGTLNCTGINIQGILPRQNAAPIAASGKIELRNADIYDAPAMLRLLRELGIREKDPNAGTFNSADIDFKLSGNQFYFDPIIFEGNLFSIFGSGTMLLDSQQIDLMMKTRLGNRRTQIPLLSGLIGGVGDQIIQLKIAGPVSNPSIERIALPNLL